MRQLYECFDLVDGEFVQKSTVNYGEKLLVTEDYARRVYDRCINDWDDYMEEKFHDLLYDFGVGDFASFCIDRGYSSKERPDEMKVILDYVKFRYPFETWFKDRPFVFTFIEVEYEQPYVFAEFSSFRPKPYVDVVFDDELEKLRKED